MARARSPRSFPSRRCEGAGTRSRSSPSAARTRGRTSDGCAGGMPSVSVVVVTYNALPWVERSLESVRGHETIVVDHGSTDGTLELVRERFPDAQLLEVENRGLAAGWNAGLRRVSTR